MTRPEDETAAETARRLMRDAETAALATRMADGWPYASLVLVAADGAGRPLLLLSALAEHCRNMEADNRVSLLIDGTKGLEEPLTGPRLTLLGRAAKTDAPEDRECYLARHPSARDYAAFGDFSFYRVELERAHLVAGFGRIQWLDGEDLTAPTP